MILKTDLRKAAFTRSGFLALLVTLVCMCSPCQVQAQKDSIKLLQKDTRAITPRYPDPGHLEKFVSDRDYQYTDDPQPPANPLAKWFDYFKRKFFALFTGKAYDHFWQYVMMAGTLALVIFLLYKANILGYIFPSPEQEATDYIVGEENIHEIDFEQAVVVALAGGDYRLAVRLQYLKTLKTLSNLELINWKPNRTNNSYVMELERYLHRNDFVQITNYFEYIWYGDFRVDESGYKEMKAFSDAFYHKLTQRSHV